MHPRARETLRYRTEDGEACIDIGVDSIGRLLDHRDPAPFRDRDLDPGLVEYLLDAAEDLAPQPRLHVVFWIAEHCPAQEIELAYRAHFADALRRIRRKNQQRRRVGISALLAGGVLLVLLLSLSQLIRSTLPGPIGAALAEGAIILSWIALWRPVDVLLFDWIPVLQERRTIEKLLAAAVDVRIGPAPFSPSVSRPARA